MFWRLFGMVRLVLLVRVGIAVFAAGLIACLPVGAVEVTGDDLPKALKQKLERELPAEDQPETRFEAHRQAKRAAARLTDFLNSEGYFAANITPRVEDGPPVTAYVDIVPGSQFRVQSTAVAYRNESPEPEVQERTLAAIDLPIGQRAIPAQILAAETRGVAALKAAGFADARALERDVLGDAEAGTLEVTFQFETGPRVRFGKVIFESDGRVKQRFQKRLIPFKPGDAYSPARLALYNQRLAETRLYSVFSARLSEDTALIAEDGSAVRDVIVSLVPRKSYSIAVGAGFSTEDGPGATFEVSRFNATGRGDVLRANIVAAQREQSLSLIWDVPNALGFGRSVSTSAFVAREDTDAFERTAIALGTSIGIFPCDKGARRD
ncbi:MAG: hypothetical protein AAGJ50_08975 [Pseudomonadota bacterium]